MGRRKEALPIRLRAEDIPQLETLREMVRFVAGRYEGETAFVIPRKGGAEDEISFRAFSDDIDALGTALFAQGLRGSRIALLGGNSYEWIVSYFAAAGGGCTVVPLDKDLQAGDLVPLIENSGCRALIYAPDYADMLPEFRGGTAIGNYICMSEMAALLAEGRRLLLEGNTDYTGCALSPEQPAVIVYTSGTTGKAKGVMLSHRNIASNAASACRMVSGAGRVVLALPCHHTFGLLVGVIVPLMYCGRTYISRSVRNVQKDMVKLRATVAILVPAIVEVVYKKMWEAAERKGSAAKMRRGLKLSRALMKLGIDVRRKLFKEVHEALGGELYLMVCGGAPLNEQITKDFYAMGIDLLNGYGITECAPVVSVNPQRPNKIGSVGLPLDCCRVRVDMPDEDGIGEVQVLGSNVMMGYYGDEAATKAAFTQDGWFKTGDLGYLDRDGYLYVTGRIKHLIILNNGKNVSPEELEEKIKLLPGVLEAAVYAQDGQIAAEVYTDTDEASVRGAIHEMNRGLPKFKQIALVKFRDTEFPKTTTMKIKKHSIGGAAS
ncbi:MAG: AMP-binding protein [Firmicutes bacterium]|nr:AMP-binding protein [Bacillota bacterium]